MSDAHNGSSLAGVVVGGIFLGLIAALLVVTEEVTSSTLPGLEVDSRPATNTAVPSSPDCPSFKYIVGVAASQNTLAVDYSDGSRGMQRIQQGWQNVTIPKPGEWTCVVEGSSPK